MPAVPRISRDPQVNRALRFVVSALHDRHGNRELVCCRIGNELAQYFGAFFFIGGAAGSFTRGVFMLRPFAGRAVFTSFADFGVIGIFCAIGAFDIAFFTALPRWNDRDAPRRPTLIDGPLQCLQCQFSPVAKAFAASLDNREILGAALVRHAYPNRVGIQFGAVKAEFAVAAH